MIKEQKIGFLVVILGSIVLMSLMVPLGSLGSPEQTQMKPTQLKKESKMSLTTAPPQIDIISWRLKIDGSIEHPMSLTYDELGALPAVTVSTSLTCVSGARVDAGNWTGVQLSYLLILTEVKSEAVDMVFYATDDYSSSLPVKEVRNRPDMILAYEKDGKQLTDIEGFPAIVVAPGKWGYKWVKYVEHIELVVEDYRGYWENRGYSDAADIPNYAHIPAEVIFLTTEPSVYSIIQEKTVIVTEFGRAISYVVITLLGLLSIGYKKR
ncbi:MAG: molybdopterin-dependent oxidoreductase [Candidatus Heimdallarchaeota archaeon]